jgi:hypothetical protein
MYICAVNECELNIYSFLLIYLSLSLLGSALSVTQLADSQNDAHKPTHI